MTRKEYEHKLDTILEYLLVEIHNSMNGIPEETDKGRIITNLLMPTFVFSNEDIQIIKEFATEHCIDLSLITD